MPVISHRVMGVDRFEWWDGKTSFEHFSPPALLTLTKSWRHGKTLVLRFASFYAAIWYDV